MRIYANATYKIVVNMKKTKNFGNVEKGLWEHSLEVQDKNKRLVVRKSKSMHSDCYMPTSIDTYRLCFKRNAKHLSLDN